MQLQQRETVPRSARTDYEATASDQSLFAISQLGPEASYSAVGSGFEGLLQEEAERRLKSVGLNLVTREQKPSIGKEIWNRANNPLNALLLVLAAISYFLGDVRASVVIAVMVVLAISTAFMQEHRANEAAAR